MSTPPAAPSRRWHIPRHILWNTAGVAVALTAVVAALVLWLNSPQFESLVRLRLSQQVQNMAGGRVEIGAFHWSLLHLEAEADHVIIHGDEPAGEAPYASIASLRARFSVLGVVSPRIRLRSLDIDQPRMHIIFYPDRTTNQPHPVRSRKTRRSALETLFSLQAGHVAITDGLIHLDNRAASLDFQNRYQPLDFRGDDLSLTMRYVAAAGNAPESYRIEASVRDLTLARGGAQAGKTPAVHGVLSATLDLTRDAAMLRSLELTAHTRGAADQTLHITGALTHFAEPQWNATLRGDLDMRLLDPVLGYPFAPEGIAHLDLTCGGEDGQFGIDGTVHAEHASYIGTGVVARGVDLTARVHADPQQLRITGVVARLQQGGAITGEVLLSHWLPPTAAQTVIHAGIEQNVPRPTLRQRLASHFHAHAAAQTATARPETHQETPHSTLIKAPNVDIPVDGKVTAAFQDVALDTILDLVSEPPYQRLGISSLVSGATTAVWNHGDVKTLAVDAKLNLTPSAQPPQGEAAAGGLIDATYFQRDGSVDVRALDVRLPTSRLQAHGRLGAYPITSPTALAVDLHSGNLREFDTVLRSLGLKREGKSGAAALPIALTGQANFAGNWEGSLESPRLAGSLQATQIAVEFPAPQADAAPRWVRWDSVQADGAYDAEHIAIVHATLHRGAAQIDLDGALLAAPASIAIAALAPKHQPPGAGLRGDEAPAFDPHAILRLHARATKISMDDLLPIVGEDLPIRGSLDTQISVEGPLNALAGTGWAELNNGAVYGEPVESLRVQGSLSERTAKLTSFNARTQAGTVAGSGSYDFGASRFQGEAHGNGIDLAKIDRLRTSGEDVSGKLGFTLAASGTLDQPQVQASGAVTGFAVQGQALGTLSLNAHTDGRMLIYDAGTRLDSAQLTLHAQTELHGDYATAAKLDISNFDIGSVFKLAHLDTISAQSSLVGMANISGPLRRPEELHGELSLQQMALTVAGVRLQSTGALHATLAHAQVNLDPLQITGDGTDVHVLGTLALSGKREMNLGASGSVNMKLIQTLDPDLTASGTTQFQVEARGPLTDPSLGGTVEFQNGSMTLGDLPNGLSQLNGRLRFNQNRLEVVSLTAMTGGGKLSLGGYLAYRHGMYADLSVTGNSIRIRYPEGVSSLADTSLHLQGTPASLFLSGNVLLTRFSVSPDLDMAALAARATAAQEVAPPNAPLNHVRLDVRIRSSPQLNFQNAYAKLAGDVDLRLRGTAASPSLQGRVSITEGNAMIAGTRYELQRGDITFSNPVRIQPVIDLNATARVEDYDITLGLHGTPDKLSVTYRSDPPLPEADVVALLALGRTQSEQGLYTEQQQQSIGLSPSTDILLGGALNATVSSRVQKLFGAGSVKVDPSYLGALGNSTTRITVEEQVGKNLTLTYATNVDTSAQQLLQAEIAINRHVALLVTRDESGVFSMVFKATRRYR